MKKGRLEIRISPQEKLFLMESSKRLGYTNISDFIMDLCKEKLDIHFPINIRNEEALLSHFTATNSFSKIETGQELVIEECLPFNFMKTEDNFYIFCPIGFYPIIFRKNDNLKKLQYKIVKDFISLEELLDLLTKTKDSWNKEEADYLHNYYYNLYNGKTTV